MLSRRHCLLASFALIAALLPWPSSPAGAVQIPDFCFLQVSDLHTNPQPVGAPDPKPTDRSVETIAWVCAESTRPQRLDPVDLTVPAPAFVIATGDLTEYGVINKTWANFEHFFEPLTIPLYVTPGNHDNTWTAMQSIMRRRRGGDHYSWDQFGCHFVSINTASIQEPVPGIEQRTLHWLARDLQKVSRETPVFIFCHHPLSSGEFAKPHEQLRLLDLIDRYHVALLLMGHGHSPRHERWGKLDSVMGGETFRKNVGYNIISVKEGVLRVVYRFRDPATPMKVLVEKPIARPEAPVLDVLPRAGSGPASPSSEPRWILDGRQDELRLAARVRGKRVSDVRATLDGDKRTRVELRPAAAGRAVYRGSLEVAGLLPGEHLVRVTAEADGYQFDRAASLCYCPDGKTQAPPRVTLDAGMKAAPILLNDRAIVATTAGDIIAITFTKPQPKATTLFETGTEIIRAPVPVDDRLYFSAAEWGVGCLGIDGKLHWRCDVGAVVYGTPAVGDDQVYVGDLEGAIHAIDRASGKLIFSKRHATYSIEQPLLLHAGVLYFGAWDGFLYAVDARDGSLKWKVHGPAGHRDEAKFKSRYYAPADCTPVLIGDRLFVADRAYVLGAYALNGDYLGEIADETAGIGPTEDGHGFYARGLEAGLTRYDTKGKVVWSKPVALGRFPIAPTAAAGRVFACSNRGLLTAHNADTGEILGKYAATAQLHVMAPVAADAHGSACVAGMDGTVTLVRLGAD